MKRIGSPHVVVLIYSVVSLCWIFLSDLLVHRITSNAQTVTAISVVKGFLFVVVTAMLIHYLLRRVTQELERVRRAEDAHTESEQRFRLMADHAPVLVWVANSEGLCDYFNRGWLEFTGRPLEKELGDGWVEGVHPDDRQSCLDDYRQAFDKRESFRLEYRLRRHDGQYRWILDNGVPRYSDAGVFAGYIGSCVDITALKAAQDALANANAGLQQEVAHRAEELRRGEARYRRIIENAEEGIWELDAQDRVTFLNPKMAALMGYSVEEVLGTTAESYMDAEWRAVVRSALHMLQK